MKFFKHVRKTAPAQEKFHETFEPVVHAAGARVSRNFQSLKGFLVSRYFKKFVSLDWNETLYLTSCITE